MGILHFKSSMAQQAQQKKKTVHAYKMSAKSQNGQIELWVSDKITKKRWQTKFNKDSFPNQELKDIFSIIQKALNSQSWKATYPQQDGQGLYIEINDGAI